MISLILDIISLSHIECIYMCIYDKWTTCTNTSLLSLQNVNQYINLKKYISFTIKIYISTLTKSSVLKQITMYIDPV